MLTISLWEPWASAIAVGIKASETRGWSTNYRGQIAIHAAKTTQHALFIKMPEVQSYFAAAGLREIADLSFGHVVAVAELFAVFRTEQCSELSVMERALGNYAPQGFFDVPDSLLESQP